MKKKITHVTKPQRKKNRQLLLFIASCGVGFMLLVLLGVVYFEKKFADRVYPHVFIGNQDFTGATNKEVATYWLSRNAPFENLTFTFQFENHIATLSANNLDIGFDASLSATQAVDIGRSGKFVTDIVTKYKALTSTIRLEPLFRWREEVLDNTLEQLASEITIEPENALFEFQKGRVVAFKLSQPGRSVDITASKKKFLDQLALLSTSATPNTAIILPLTIIAKEPLIKTDQVNSLGITQLIGKGESFFSGSIPGRVHNVALAASRINGILIPPGNTFSFNQALGDISAATGYKQAYVIKSGHTVLDDGGGVCQVSTTLFRAALNAGLNIAERHAHSYRVGYYEQGGWKPGFDATVYAPSYDLKIVNDTPAHILIQAITDITNTHLTFELYGKSDGRVAETTAVKLTDPKPAPPDLYQDDPTLPIGQVKQVDFANAGIKASFDYTVVRNGELLYKQTFFSNFVPWQAVFLKGTKT